MKRLLFDSGREGITEVSQKKDLRSEKSEKAYGN